jgi:hypothetical protein
MFCPAARFRSSPLDTLYPCGLESISPDRSPELSTVAVDSLDRASRPGFPPRMSTGKSLRRAAPFLSSSLDTQHPCGLADASQGRSPELSTVAVDRWPDATN